MPNVTKNIFETLGYLFLIEVSIIKIVINLKSNKMKSVQKTSIITLVFLVILTSCSVEKRHYMSGYNFDWKKGKSGVISKEGDMQITSNIENDTESNPVRTDISEEVLTASANKEQQIVLPQKAKTNFALIDNPLQSFKKEKAKPTFKSEFKKGLKILEAPNDEPKTHGLAVAGMILGILSLVTFYGAFLFGLLAIIFGAVAISKIKANPNKYKGKGMAKAGLICGIIAIAVILILISAG